LVSSVAATHGKEAGVTASEDFDRTIEASHRALEEIARGDPSAFFDLYSKRDDATLANPFGPPARGRSQIEEAGRRAASNYRDGRAVEFESFAKYVTADLAYPGDRAVLRRRSAGARRSRLCPPRHERLSS
jgi:ketosteroid isomerase-like protein